MTSGIVLSWILPILFGMGIWQVLNGSARQPAAWAVTLGYGYLLGVLLIGWLGPVFAATDTRHIVVHFSGWLAAGALIMWGLAWTWRRRIAVSFRTQPLSHVQSVLCGILITLLLLRGWVITAELLLRPIFPWDAWAAWAVKPKTWFLLGYAVPFVSMSDWLAQPQANAHTAIAWSYPNLLSWIEVWFASGAKEWNEPLVNLAWFGVWSALLMASYGQWRNLGLSPMRACLATYILGSLPLMNAHVALAGYADIWLAVVLGLAVLAWLNWLHTRAFGQWVTAVFLALCLPAIKLEGAVWLLCFALVLVFSHCPARWRGLFGLSLLMLGVVGIALGGFLLPIYGLGWVKIAWGEVDVPTLGTLTLHWRTVGQAMLASLYTLPNWHLLWFLLPVILLWRWREFRRSEMLRLLGGLLLLCLTFLFVLFFFTEAGRWAENYTSANRLIMHITPVIITLLALLLRDVDLGAVASDTGSRSVGLPAPG